MRRRRPAARLFAALGAGILLAMGAGVASVDAPVGAAPIDDLQKQAQALEAEINANADQLAALNEQIKAAQDKVDAANRAIADAQARIAAAQAETDRLTALVRERAAAMYRSASMGGNDPLFTQGSALTLSVRTKYAQTASARDNLLMSQLAAARADLQVVKKDAQDAKAAAEQEHNQLARSKSQFDAAQSQRQSLLGQVQGEIKTLVAQAAAARRAAETPPAFDPSKVPPASGRAGIAVSYALQQVGKPYSYAGAGPSSYDCSGLTMAAWGAAGVSMAHNSEAQHASFPRVGIANVAPGDIVWFPGHVGIYVGNGTVVDAGNENSGVRYSPLGWYQDAVRPS